LAHVNDLGASRFHGFDGGANDRVDLRAIGVLVAAERLLQDADARAF
jgi:hypothetical protein